MNDICTESVKNGFSEVARIAGKDFLPQCVITLCWRNISAALSQNQEKVLLNDSLEIGSEC